MKNSDPYWQSTQAAYIARMVELQKASGVPKKPPTTEQAPSTQSTLERPVERDLEHFCRALPGDEAKAVPNAHTLDEAVGARNITPEEYGHIEAIRRRPKN